MDDSVHLAEPPRICSYLPQQTASLNYRVGRPATLRDYAELFRRGWRRHGRYFFRPGCPACRECRSLRVPVAAFRPSRSQRKCIRRNAGVRVEAGRQQVTTEHVRLFNAWHQDMAARRNWPYREDSVEDYFEAFLTGDHPIGSELRFYDGPDLVGVSLIDVAADSVSSVYFYHDPVWRPAGPGTFSLLHEWQFARQHGLAYWYLGYWIAGCQSMNYKARFGPHELLDAYVADDQEPVWTPQPPSGSRKP